MWSLWTLSPTIIVVCLIDKYGPFSIALSRCTVESFKSLNSSSSSLLQTLDTVRCPWLNCVCIYNNTASSSALRMLRHMSHLRWLIFPPAHLFSHSFSLTPACPGQQGASGWGSSTGRVSDIQGMSEQLLVRSVERHRAQELCECRGGRPGLPSLINLRLLWT